MMNFFVTILNVSVIALYVMVNSLQFSDDLSFIACLGIAHCLDDSDEHPSHCQSDFNIKSRSISSKSSRSRTIFIVLLLIFILLILFLIYFLSRHSFISFPIPLLNPPKQNNYSAIIQSRMFTNEILLLHYL